MSGLTRDQVRSLTSLDARYVNVTGDTMTGLLTLSGAPTADLHAATKKYVDDSVAFENLWDRTGTDITTHNAGDSVTISGVADGSGNDYGLQSSSTFTSGTTTNLRGSNNIAVIDGSTDVTTMVGSYGLGQLTSTGEASQSALGVFGDFRNDGTATQNVGVGVFGSITNASTGSISLAASVSGGAITNSGGGTVTSAYSFYGFNQTAGTNNWGIYDPNNWAIAGDKSLFIGAGQDASIGYDGTNVNLNTQLVGSGKLVINSTTGFDGVIDDDTMATASATTLATSESIKAYTDTQDALYLPLAGGTMTGAITLSDQTDSIKTGNYTGYLESGVTGVGTAPSQSDAGVVSYWTFDDNAIDPVDDADADLIGHWKLDDGSGSSAADSSGNGYTGTLTSSSWLGSGPFNYAGDDSVTFTGSSSQISMGDNNAFSFGDGSSDSPFTAYVWVYPTATTFGGIFSKWNNTGSNEEWIIYQSAGGVVCLLRDKSTGGLINVAAASSLTLNQWNFICVTYDGSSANTGVEIYVDGVNAVTGRSTSGTYIAMENTSTPLLLGTYGAVTDVHFPGSIGNAALYSAEKTANEVARDYAKGIDTVVADYVGTNHGALTGTSFTDPGYFGYTGDEALDFNGTSAVVSVPDSSDLSFGNGSTDSAFTIYSWAKADTYGALNPIIGKYSSGTTREYELYYESGVLKFLCYDESLNGFIGRSYSTVVSDTDWHFYAVTYSGSGASSGVKIYKDGVQVDNANNASGSYIAMENLSGTFDIGRLNNGTSTYYFDGSIDNCVVFNDVRSAAEILADYNSGLPAGDAWIHNTANTIGATGTLAKWQNNGVTKAYVTSAGGLNLADDLIVDTDLLFVDVSAQTININNSVSVNQILDEDNMATNSAMALATQQSIKAYVDAQVDTIDTLAEILAYAEGSNTTGGTDLIVTAGDTLTTDTIAETTAGSGVTFNDQIIVANQADSLTTGNYSLQIQSKATETGASPTLNSPQTMVVYNKFDDGSGTNLNDETASNLDGTLVGSPTWSADRGGSYGYSGDYSVAFNGSSQYVNHSANVASLSRATGSIHLRFKYTGSGAYTLFDVSKNSTTDYFSIVVGGNITGLYADESLGVICNTTTGGNVLQVFVRNGDGFYADNAWHSLVVTQNGSGMKIYVDGVEQSLTFAVGSASTAQFTDTTAPTAAYLARRGFTGSPTYLPGSLDSFIMYSTALSAAEVLTLHNNAVGGSSASIADTSSTYSSTTSKLWEWRNNGTSKSYIDKDGGFVSATGGVTALDLTIDTNLLVADSTLNTVSITGDFDVTGTTTLDQTDIGASISLPYVAKTGAYTITDSDYTIDCTANTFTVTLPTAVGITGRIYQINNSGTGVITVDGDGSETINGSATQTLNQWESITVQSDGANWIVN